MLMLAVKTVVAVASGKIIRTKLRSSQIRKLSAAIVCAALALSFSPVLQASIFSQGEGSDERVNVEFNEPIGWANVFGKIRSEYHSEGNIRWEMEMMVGTSIRAFGHTVGIYYPVTLQFDSFFTTGKDGEERENDTNSYREPGTDVPWYGGDSQGVEAAESQTAASSPTFLGGFEIEDEPDGPNPSGEDDEGEKDDDTNVGIGQKGGLSGNSLFWSKTISPTFLGGFEIEDETDGGFIIFAASNPLRAFGLGEQQNLATSGVPVGVDPAEDEDDKDIPFGGSKNNGYRKTDILSSTGMAVFR